MEDDNDFVEVTIISDTECQANISPLQIIDLIEALLELNPDRDSLRNSSEGESEHSQKSDDSAEEEEGSDFELASQECTYGLRFDDLMDSEGILKFITFSAEDPISKWQESGLSHSEIKAIADYQKWTQSEPLFAEMREHKARQLQRVESEKVAFIAASESMVLLSNGRDSHLLRAKAPRYERNRLVAWGSYFLAAHMDQLTVYDSNFKPVYRVDGSNKSIQTSPNKLVFVNSVLTSEPRASIAFDRTFIEKAEIAKQNQKSLKKFQEKEHWSEVMSADPKCFSKIRRFCKQIEQVRICPQTEEVLFLNSETEERFHYLQQGRAMTILKNRYGRNEQLEIEQLAASYSGKWYLVGYPDPEPQEKNIFLIEQESLRVIDTYFTLLSECRASLHFLKPQKPIYPAMLMTETTCYLFCEFRDKLYAITKLNQEDRPHSSTRMHLSGRVWLCLDTFTKGRILVVDSDKLRKQLRLK